MASDEEKKLLQLEQVLQVRLASCVVCPVPYNTPPMPYGSPRVSRVLDALMYYVPLS